MKSNARPAFYALSSGGWRDYVTLLHLPFTLWHLSYVVLGAAAAATVHLDRVGWVVLAFFLAVGLAAHALDELHGRPLGTRISDGALLIIAAASLAGALTIGAYAALVISLWTLAFVSFGVFIVLAYNLELWGGRFHSDLWFGISWGAFPALAGYWANMERLDVQVALIASACLVLSLAQRALSKQARKLRRSAQSASGGIKYKDGSIESITISSLIAVPELTLKLLGLSISLLALGWLVARL